jgi:hypothetical protein
VSDQSDLSPTDEESMAQARRNAGLEPTSGDYAEGEGGAGGEAEVAGEGGPYDGMTKAELQEELRNRTDADGEPLPVSGNRDELVARLQENDALQT